MEMPNLHKNSKEDLCLIVVGMAGSGKTTFISNFKNHLLENSNHNIFVSNLDPVVMSVPYSCDYDIRKDFNHKKIMKKYKLGPNGAIMTCLNLFCSKIDKFIQQFESIQVNSKSQKVNFSKKGEPAKEKSEKMETIEVNESEPIKIIDDKVQNKGENVESKKPKEENTSELSNKEEEKEEGEDTVSLQLSEPSKIKNIYLIDTPGQIEAFMWSASGEIITKALASSMPTAICFILDR